MPLYEYECTACHRRTEKIQKYSDAELTVCPHCGGPLERTITAAAISFKGGGWYKDGYASAKPASSNEGSKDDSGGGSDKSNSDSANSGGNVDSSATLSASAGDAAKSGAGKSGDAAKPAESAKPAAASPAPASSSTAKD
jgi:putative FmdB family regulatory protein